MQHYKQCIVVLTVKLMTHPSSRYRVPSPGYLPPLCWWSWPAGLSDCLDSSSRQFGRSAGRRRRLPCCLWQSWMEGSWQGGHLVSKEEERVHVQKSHYWLWQKKLQHLNPLKGSMTDADIWNISNMHAPQLSSTFPESSFTRRSYAAEPVWFASLKLLLWWETQSRNPPTHWAKRSRNDSLWSLNQV